MTLLQFLQARIGEDEARAREIAAMDRRALRAPEDFARYVIDPIIGPYGGQSQLRNVASGLYLARFGDPARVLAECAAKRRIVKECEATLLVAPSTSGGSSRLMLEHGLEAILRVLASVYADHPDFREEWPGDTPTIAADPPIG